MTLILFLIITYKFIKKKVPLFKVTNFSDVLLLVFFICVLISAILIEEGFRHKSAFDVFKLVIQYFYWIVISLFIKTWIYEFDFYRLSRIFFLSTVISIVYYVFFNNFYIVFYDNELSYVLIITIPLSWYYVSRRMSFLSKILIFILFFAGIIATNSRTGLLLFLLEFIIILGFKNKISKIFSTILFATLVSIALTISIFLTNSDIDYKVNKIGLETANVIEGYSPKIAHNLRMEESVFDRDKSWLFRELMWQKTYNIFNEYPFFGVGAGNFRYYEAKLDLDSISQHLNRSTKSYNSRSPQNSFAMILSENGIFALFSIVLVIISILVKGFHSVYASKNQVEFYVYIVFIMICIYSFILVTVMGSLFWLFLGLALTLTQRKRHIS
jgi:O-antigen ligase